MLIRPAKRVVVGAKYEIAQRFNPRIMGVENIWHGDVLNMSVDAARQTEHGNINMRDVTRGVLNEEV